MKKAFLYIFPMSVLLSGCAALVYQPSPQVSYNPPPDYTQPNAVYTNYDNSPQTDQVFYDQLSPYGTWIDYPDYGYVWAPAVDSDFRPYASNGAWVYSDYGWTWASNYDWGWATFHYGRWFYDDNYGWLWMPGDEWAPAWVTWGTSGDYYCWAPLPPRVSMKEADLGWWRPAQNTWNVVPGRRVIQPNISNYVVYNTTIINNIKVINSGSNGNYGQGNRGAVYGGAPASVDYNRGPQLIDVERVTNNRINKVLVSEQTKPGAVVVSNNRIGIYRPQINPNNNQGNGSPAPQRFERYKGNQGQPSNHNGQFNYPNNNNGQNQQNQQPTQPPNNNQDQYKRGNNGQNQQPVQTPNNNQNQYQRGNNGQNQQPAANPNNNQDQYQKGNSVQNQQPATNPNNSQNQYQKGTSGQNRQPATNPNNSQSSEQQSHGNQNPGKNYLPPVQQQPNNVGSENKPANSNQGQNPNQQQSRTEPNPVMRQNVQPVHNNGQPNGANGQNNKNQPKAKPDTSKRRPNNQ